MLRPVVAMRDRPSPTCAARSCATAPRNCCCDEREKHELFLNACVIVFKLRTAFITSAAGLRWQTVERLMRL